MKKLLFLFSALLICILGVKPMFAADKGFDEFGYNRTANNFNGTGWSWCMGKVGDEDWCQAYLGDYANDHLVMKWNEAWDSCNAAGNDDETACLGAWTTNHWNGMMPDGSESNWVYKYIWVGSEGEDSPYWVEGGYSIWGSYEVILDQGKDPSYGDGHIVFAHATPNGLGLK